MENSFFSTRPFMSFNSEFTSLYLEGLSHNFVFVVKEKKKLCIPVNHTSISHFGIFLMGSTKLCLKLSFFVSTECRQWDADLKLATTAGVPRQTASPNLLVQSQTVTVCHRSPGTATVRCLPCMVLLLYVALWHYMATSIVDFFLS